MKLLLGLTTLVLAAALAAFVVRVAEITEGLRGQLSGFMLVAVVALLGLYNLRSWVRRRPHLASRWYRVHLWLGVFAVVLFFLHTGAALPSGVLESSLYVAFAVAAGSGVAGAWRMRADTDAAVTDGERAMAWQLLHYPATDVVLALSLMHVLLVLHTFGGAVR